jgi:16S rRNA (guanine527-N7)-methyltransferase
MENILRYFPELSARQREQIKELEGLYRDWNSKINVISRKDIDHLYVHHVLHSLAIARVVSFYTGTTIMDIGTGGGFPGIPLAIFFPQCQFTLVDSVGKKVLVAQAVAQTLGLGNVKTLKARAEEVREVFDFVVSRAVAPMPTLLGWVRNSIRPGGVNSLANGLIALKGGDIKEEIKPYRKILQMWAVNDFFGEEYFTGKYVVYIPK